MGASPSKTFNFTTVERENIEHITQYTPKERKQEFLDVITNSFIGTSTTAPEGGMYWVMTGEAHDDKPLKFEPSEDYRNIMKWYMAFPTIQSIEYGGLFALTDPATGEILAATVCVPNVRKGKTNLHETGVRAIARAVYRMGLPPSGLTGPIPTRLDAFTEQMKREHHKFAAQPHWYVWNFATNPLHQGKGCGKRLMQYICDLADAEGVDVFLETQGEKNIGFYSKFGFEVKSQCALKMKEKDEAEVGGGLYTYMLRPTK